ncbi:MAG: FecR domain-containing protein [Candidatus Wallbacteria bacterium]|nr:FecR domain-containing protein [Candidatus Wallbacteria bacterium]
MSCERYRTALAERADGESPGTPGSELEAHLAGCDGCRRELEALRRAVETLRADISVEPPESMTRSVMERVRAEARPVPRVGKQGGSASWVPADWWRFATGLAVGAVATVAALWLGGDRPGQGVAPQSAPVVTRVPDVVPTPAPSPIPPTGGLQVASGGRGEWRQAAPAPALRAGDTVRAVGAAGQLLLATGTRVTVSPDSALVFESAAQLTLTRGRLELHAVSPIAVRTPNAKVSVLGTRFSVELSSTGHTLIHVTSGRVAVLELATGSSKELAAGQSHDCPPAASPSAAPPSLPSSSAPPATPPRPVTTIQEGF